MSAIQDKIKALKEQEEKLKLEQLKIEFLKHIQESVVSYNQPAFSKVKEEVVALVTKFVTRTIGEIEGLEVKVEQTASQTLHVVVGVPPSTPAKPQATPEMSLNEKMNFALDNRHLSGKKVKVANNQNIDINGEVVGLDAPFVLVKTDTGPTIKVPLPNVSLV